MKKIVLLTAALGVTCMTMGQEKFVTAALLALKEKNYEEAKQDIDRAMTNIETKESPKALFAKAQIYFELNKQEKYKDQKPYREGTQALLKLIELKPDFRPDEISNYLLFGASLYYNDGTTDYNEKKQKEALEELKYTVKIHDIKTASGARRFSKIPKFDTVSAQADLIISRIAYNNQNYEEAIPLIIKVKDNPITRTKDNFHVLLDAYDKYNTSNNNKMMAEEMAAVQEGRTAFPDDPNIKNMELNCYVKNNKLGDLLKKMEERAVSEPNVAENHYNIGLLYQGLAYPKEGKKPANAAEYVTKSEAAFQKAVTLAPDNARYNYDFGAMYFLQAYEANEKMGAITGSTKADNDKAADLKKTMDAAFDKALVKYEKAASILGAMSASAMNVDNKEVYRATLASLKQIYAAKNLTDKMNDASAKLKALE